MTMSYETGAKKLERGEVDLINYSDVHRHDPKKIIAFAPVQDTRPVHPSMRSRHRRMERRMERRRALLVTYPRYLSVILLMLFVYLHLASFAEIPAAGLNFLWIGSYALIALSAVFSHLLNDSSTR